MSSSTAGVTATSSSSNRCRARMLIGPPRYAAYRRTTYAAQPAYTLRRKARPSSGASRSSSNCPRWASPRRRAISWVLPATSTIPEGTCSSSARSISRSATVWVTSKSRAKTMQASLLCRRASNHPISWPVRPQMPYCTPWRQASPSCPRLSGCKVPTRSPARAWTHRACTRP